VIEVSPPTPGPGSEAIAHLPSDTRLRGEHPRAAVFLDRDGVLVEDVHFLRRPEDVRILPGVVEALRELRPRYSLVVVSNQSGIARGYLGPDDLLAIHRRIVTLLAAEGAALDALYACPHLAEGNVELYRRVCDCRKPEAGLLLRAAREHSLALDLSTMIGDDPRDVEAGARAGTHTVLLTPQPTPASDGGPTSLLEATRWIP